MRIATTLITLLLAAVGASAGGPASGTVKSSTGTISPKFATAYLVRDQRNPRQSIVEVLLTVRRTQLM